MNNLSILFSGQKPGEPSPPVISLLRKLGAFCSPLISEETLSDSSWDLVYCNSGFLEPDITDRINREVLFYDYSPADLLFQGPRLNNVLTHTSVLKTSGEDIPELSRTLFGKSQNSGEFFKNLIYCYSIELMIITEPASGADFFYRAMPDDLLSIGTGRRADYDKNKWDTGFTAAFIHSFLNGERLYKAAEKAASLAEALSSLQNGRTVLRQELRRELGLAI